MGFLSKIFRPSTTPDGIKILWPDKINDSSFQRWYKDFYKIKKGYRKIYRSDNIGYYLNKKWKKLEEKENNCINEFINYCYTQKNIKTILIKAGKSKEWLKDIFLRYANTGNEIAGGIIISQSNLLQNYFLYLARDEWTEEDAFIQSFLDTGSVDNYMMEWGYKKNTLLFE